MIIILLPILGVLISVVWWTIRNGISPMPTSSKVKKSLFGKLPNPVEGTVYELGSGWGTLLMPLGKIYASNSVVGIESSPVPYWVSKIWLSLAREPNVKVKRRDFFSEDLSEGGLVVCYLYPGAMPRLQAKLEKELKPGTWVISHTFAIPGWKPEETHFVDDLYHTKIYIYVV